MCPDSPRSRTRGTSIQSDRGLPAVARQPAPPQARTERKHAVYRLRKVARLHIYQRV